MSSTSTATDVRRRHRLVVATTLPVSFQTGHLVSLRKRMKKTQISDDEVISVQDVYCFDCQQPRDKIHEDEDCPRWTNPELYIGGTPGERMSRKGPAYEQHRREVLADRANRMARRIAAAAGKPLPPAPPKPQPQPCPETVPTPPQPPSRADIMARREHFYHDCDEFNCPAHLRPDYMGEH